LSIEVFARFDSQASGNPAKEEVIPAVLKGAVNEIAQDELFAIARRELYRRFLLLWK